MILIKHRVNIPGELDTLDPGYGVEMDIRSEGGRLIVSHEPFQSAAPSLDDWLGHFRHGTLILNVKEEGLEERLLVLMRRHGIGDFFFLDQSFPFLLRTARAGERRCAVRVSEYESVETALAVARLVDWAWVDCFTRFPLDRLGARRLADAGLRLCLVSPELEGHDPETAVPAMRAILATEGIEASAVCTKRPDLWR